MVVCRFWEKGNCRNGDSCRFEHPGARASNQGRNPFEGAAPNDSRSQPRNPFDVLRDEPRSGPRGGDSYRPDPRRFDDNRGRGQGLGGSAQNPSTERNFRFDADAIKTDLTRELPEWPFSNYAGAGTADIPKHFFNPAIEQSPEEIRAEYYLARLQGREAQAQQSERNAHEAALAEIENLRRDIHGAIRKVAAAKREHPNRWDLIDPHKGSGNPNPFTPAPLPLAPSSSPTQPTAFGQTPVLSPGGNPFSQPTAPAQAPGFGQPSQLGQRSSGFGQPSQLSRQPAFGQQSQPGSGGFGQPSQLGQQSHFSQSSQPQGASPFGQPSALGQKSAFGQPSASGQGSAFGQPSTLGSAGGFGKPSPLGPSGSLGTKPSAFGQQASSGPSPFGQVSQQAAQAGPFGQPSKQAAQVNPFGQPAQSPFGQQQSQGAGGFGQPSQPQQPTNNFGQQSAPFGRSSSGFTQPAQQSTGGFGAPAQPQNALKSTLTTNGTQQTPLQINTSQPAMNGTYTTNPASATPRDSDPPDEMYGDRKAEFEEAYKHVLATGSFAEGIMPEVAPLHNWVGWGPMEKKFQA